MVAEVGMLAWVFKGRLGKSVFFKYILIGVLSVLIDYLGLYIAFSVLNINVKIAVTIGFFMSVFFNYIANKLITFNHKDKHLSTMVKYVLLALSTYLLTLYIVSELLTQGVSVYVAKLLSISIVFLISFTVNKYFVYQ